MQEPPQQQQQQPQPQSPSSRSAAFRRVLGEEPAVDMGALRALAFGGVPDEPRERGLRAAVWRLLLGLLPPERAQWERVLRGKRAQYAQFCEVGGGLGGGAAGRCSVVCGAPPVCAVESFFHSSPLKKLAALQALAGRAHTGLRLRWQRGARLLLSRCIPSMC